MSGFYTDTDGKRWVRFGPWTLPRNDHQDRLRIDWIHAAKGADSPYIETTKDGEYTLELKLTDALLTAPFFSPTKPAKPVEAA